MAHTCQSLVITCIDFRFQDFINKWIAQNLPVSSFDRVAFAGAVKDFETIQKQIEVSKRLHDIKEVVLVNHEDCGAYGEAGTPEKHAQDLKSAAEKIKAEFPDINIKSFYLHLDGTFEEVI